jgi:hypothetical protein
MTLREIVYMIMDELKLMSDDSYFNEDHVRFLVNKHRANILKQLYAKDNNPPSESNYQTIEVTFKTDGSNNEESDNDFYFSNKDSYLSGNATIPTLLSMSKTKVTTKDSRFGYTISLIPKDRMKFVGHNKWLRNIIYCAIDENRLYVYTYYDDLDTSLVGDNELTFKVRGIFEDPESVNTSIDILDKEYPIEPSVVPVLIQSVVAELAPKTIQPEDSYNNASDDRADLARYIHRNLKSDLAKQLTQ